MSRMTARTLQVDGETYICHSGQEPTAWQVLVRKDGNEAAYRPVFLSSWDEQRQQGYEKFMLLPAPGCGEGPLIQISFYRPPADAGEAQHASVALADMMYRCRIPAAIEREPATRRVLVTLLCTLVAQPEDYRLAVTLPADTETTFHHQHRERAGMQLRRGGPAFLSTMEKLEEQLLTWATQPDDDVYLYRIAAKLFLGLQAMQERKFGKAEEHFREAREFDDADDSEAYFLLGLSLLWQRKTRQASEIFYEDCVDRCVRLPAFFSLWSDLCRYGSPAAYFAALEKIHADRLGFDGEEEEWCDDEPVLTKETPEATAHRMAQALLERAEEHYELELDEEGSHSSGNCLLSAAFCFLRQDYRGCLKELQPLSPSSFTGFTPMWAVWFWKAMAYLELGRYRDAKKFLAQAIAQQSPVDSIPPILVSPLLWGLERHRAFFDAQIQILLAQHIPFLLAKTHL